MKIFKNNLPEKFISIITLIFGLNTISIADDFSDKLSFNGYYSIDFTYVDDDLELVSTSKESRVYEKDELSTSNSIIGGQLEYRFTDKLSVFLQGSVFANQDNSVDANLDWAYMSYDLGHDYNIRAGRFQIPFLSGTELREIGYTRLWTRPLIPGNGASGNEYHTGLEVLKRYSNGNNNWEFQLAAGKAEHELADVDNQGIQLFSTKYQRDGFWLRSAFMYSEFSVTTPRGVKVTDSGHAFLGSLETEWQFDKFQLNLGYSDTRTIVVPEDKMAYLSLAYHINDKVTPYVVGVRQNQHFELFEVQRDGPPPVEPPPLPPVGDKDLYLLGIGARVEIAPRMALKFQLENVRSKDATRIQNGITHTEGNAFTVVLEGIF